MVYWAKLPDIIFCDIDMPQMSGLELRKKLNNIDVCIFITSYPDYAVDSFEVQALDFIVKPIKADRFAKTMERVLHYLSIKHKAELLITAGAGDIDTLVQPIKNILEAGNDN